MKSQTDKYNCKVVIDGELVFDKNFKSYDDIGLSLGLSKHVISALVSGRTSYKKFDNCRFFPKITINYLNTT